MKVVKKISEAEFELEFLDSEWHKSFYDSVRERFKDLVASPSIANPEENSVRKELLRGLRAPLLDRLPNSIEWQLIELDTDDFEDIRVIRESGWNQTFGDGKKLSEVALAIQNGAQDKGGVNFPQILDIKNNIGRQVFKNKIILISKDLTGPYTVLEGNHRAVAFALRRLEVGETEHIPKEYILGVSSLMGMSPWLNS